MKNRKFLITLLLSLTLICGTGGFAACVDSQKESSSNSGSSETEGIALSEKELKLKVGETYSLTVTGTEGAVAYSSSDDSVATIDSTGKITAVSVGAAFVIVTCGEETVSCKVTVSETVYSVELDYTEIALVCGSQKQFTATVKKDGQVCDENVSWTVTEGVGTLSTDKNTAMFTATAVGEVVLTAKIDKAEATCRIKVMESDAKILASPVLTKVSCDEISWVAVEGAQSYAVRINNGTWRETTETNYACAEAADALKDYTVSVRALAGDSTEYYDGNYASITISHALDRGTVSGEPTCTTAGAVIYTCTECLRAYDEPYYEKHDYEDGKCSVCNRSQTDDATENLAYAYDETLDGYVFTGVTSAYDLSTQEVYVASVYNDGVHGEKNVVAVGEKAMYSKLQLRKIVLPDCVSAIGRDAFRDCVNLIEIQMLGVKNISAQGGATGAVNGTNAFLNCYRLERIVVGPEFTVANSIVWTRQSVCNGYTALCDVLVYGTEAESSVSVFHSYDNNGLTGKIAYYDKNMECNAATWKFDEDGNVIYGNCAYENGVCKICGSYDSKGLAYQYNEELDGYVLKGLAKGFAGLEVVVAATYNDGVHGEKAVVAVESGAFAGGRDDSVARQNGPSKLWLERIVFPESITQILGNVGNTFMNTTECKYVAIPGITLLNGNNQFLNSGVKTLVVHKDIRAQGQVFLATIAKDRYQCDLYIIGTELGAGFSMTNNAVNNNLFSGNIYFYDENGGCDTWKYVDGIATLTEHTYMNGACSTCGIKECGDVIYKYDAKKDGYIVKGLNVGVKKTSLVIEETYNDGLNGEKKVVSVEDGAFMNNETLRTLTLPETVTQIGGHAFAGCTALEKISMLGVASLNGKYQFQGCDNLSVLVVHSDFSYSGVVFELTSELYAEKCDVYVFGTAGTDFYAENDEKNKMFSGNVYAYDDGTDGLIDCGTWRYDVSGEIVLSGEHAYVNGICAKCQTPQITNGLLYEYNALRGGYYVIGFAEGYSVETLDLTKRLNDGVHGETNIVGIKENAFANDENIRKVVMGENIRIEKNAFKGCTQLSVIEFAAGVTIGERAFEGCAELTELTFPKLSSIGDYAFYACTGVKRVEFPQGTENSFGVGEYAFAECTGLKTLVLTNTLNRDGVIGATFGKHAFMNCTALEKIVGGNRFIMGAQLFYTDVEGYTPKVKVYLDMSINTGVTYVNLQAWSTSYYNNMFVLENNLFIYSETEAGGGWRWVEGEPVEWNKHAYTWTLGDYRGEVQACVYENETCTVCNGVKLTDGSLNYSYEEGVGYTVTGLYDASLTEIAIPDTFNGESVVAIADSAFRGNTKLTKVVMGNNITTIGDYAFLECKNLTSVTFSEKLEVLGHQAFQKCTSLTYVKLPSTIKELKGNVFFGCSALEVVSMITDHTVTLNPSVTAGGTTFAANNNFSFCTSLKALIVGAKFATSSQQFALNDTQTQGLMHIYSTAKAADGAGNAIHCTSGYNNLAFSGKVFFLGEEDGSWSYAADGITPVADDENVYWENVKQDDQVFYALKGDTATETDGSQAYIGADAEFGDEWGVEDGFEETADYVTAA